MKQTEIGLLPEDWEVKALGNISEKIMVGIASAATHAYTDKGVPMFRNQNIKPNYLDTEDILFLKTDFEMTFKNKRLKGGDLLTARTGYPGTTSMVPKEFEGSQSFTTLITRLGQNCNPFYISQYMNSEKGVYFFETNQIGGGQKNVNASILVKMPIPLPHLPEQEAIAEALSDADVWIESLEQLIAKKRLIKQGAMQELLKPREDWEVKKLGEVLDFGSGRDYKHLSSGDIPVYGTGGIMTFVDNYLYDGTSVGIGRKGTIDKPVLLSGKFWTVDTLFFTHSFIGVNPIYIYYQFLLIPWREYNEASGVPSLNKNTLEQIEIQIPSLTKQTCIATILSDMDTELEALETQLVKARQVKQGMMQELLTGRVRLV